MSKVMLKNDERWVVLRLVVKLDPFVMALLAIAVVVHHDLQHKHETEFSIPIKKILHVGIVCRHLESSFSSPRSCIALSPSFQRAERGCRVSPWW